MASCGWLYIAGTVTYGSRVLMSVADSLAGIDKRWYRWAWMEGDDVVVEGCRGGILEYHARPGNSVRCLFFRVLYYFFFVFFFFSDNDQRFLSLSSLSLSVGE